MNFCMWFKSGMRGGPKVEDERMNATSAEFAGVGAIGIKQKERAKIPMMVK